MEIYNKNGLLSAYGFACGYVQKVEKNGKWKQLYKEHNTYHVRTGQTGKQYGRWENFGGNELSKARKYFNSIKL